MKKIVVLLGLLFIGLVANADFIEVESNVNMTNFWEKNGKEVQKINEVGSKIINANKLDKRVPMMMERNLNVANAKSLRMDKTVVIYTGILPYIDSDDELAFILAHETAHSLDSYDGIGKWISMSLNSKQYEYKADLIGIDLMVKAGYNPVAAITVENKFFPESPFDFGIFTTHPQTSKRLFAMYKYIYKKYPWALNSEMAHNVNYQNYIYSAQKDINSFKQEEKEKASKRGNVDSL